MKRFHFPYSNERVNRKITIIDDVINTMLLLTFIFQKPIGLSRFIQHQFNVSESWSEFIIAICVIVLVCIEQKIICGLPFFDGIKWTTKNPVAFYGDRISLCQRSCTEQPVKSDAAACTSRPQLIFAKENLIF